MKLAQFVLASMLLATTAGSASVGEQAIAGAYGDALVIPDDSPARLRALNDHGDYAEFDGRFTLTGAFVYGCTYACDAPLAERDIGLYFVPDPEQVRRLPHWRSGDDIRISFDPEPRFERAVMDERLLVQTGEREVATVRATIVVEEFSTSLDCGTRANFQARFVRFVRPVAVVRQARVEGDYGCG